MKKKSLFIDSIFATGFILCSIYLLSLIEFNSDIVNPISKAMGDFKLTDVVFSHLRENREVDTNIVMVNIGPAERDRDGLAELINVLNKYEPKVIGIDAFFRNPRKDSIIDSALVKAFSRVKNLVLVSELHENPDSKICDSMSFSHPMFMRYAQPGYADMISEGKDVFKTSRECSPKERVRKYRKWKDTVLAKEVFEFGEKTLVKVDTSLFQEVFKDTVFYSFPVKMVSIYAPEKVQELMKRKNDYEIINFQGNIDSRIEGVSSNSKNTFTALDWHQVLDEKFVPEAIKGKMVFIGYLGDYIGHNAWEDKFFTPLNANYIGKAYPDMYGVVVHANIASMILKGEYIQEMDDNLNLILSLVLIFFNVWFFSYLFFRTEIWYDGLSNLITLAEILVLIIIVLVVFNYYNYKIDITLASVALFLTGNLIEIHFGIIKPSFLKYGGRIPILNKFIPIFTKN